MDPKVHPPVRKTINIIAPRSIYVIGDGPAGCATTISLMQSLAKSGESLQVVQIGERKPDSALIGETIPPAATETLNLIDLAHLLEGENHLACPGSISQWGDDKPGFNDFFYMPVGRGYHLDRERFNQDMLKASAASGAAQNQHTKLQYLSQEDAGWQLVFDTPTGTLERHADFIVDATGLRASVARSIGVTRNEYDSVISLCAFYSTGATGLPAHTLVAAEENGWWYATRLPNGRALISLCTDSESVKRFELKQPGNWFQALKTSRWFYQQCCSQFSQALAVPNELTARAAPSAILSRVTGDNWLAVGDAASSYDSFTSAGITKALQQGIEAGKAIAAVFVDGNYRLVDEYQENLFDAFNAYLRMHQQLYHGEQRYPDSGFWCRRQFSNPE